jgi:hypothetical protein
MALRIDPRMPKPDACVQREAAVVAKREKIGRAAR